MTRLALVWIAAVATLLAASRPAHGEVFVLANGGRVEGELLNPDEKPRKAYIVQVADGGRITLEAAQVEKVEGVKPDVREYEKIRHSYPDTVAGQWALAQWCLEQKLLSQRDVHLERVIELDPNHAEARRALGYSQVGGQWTKRDDLMRKRGMVPYKGRLRTPQEVELLENKRKQELGEKEWFQKIDRWRSWLGTEKREVAQRNILGIEDPSAVRALCAALKKERVLSVRTMYIETLAKIGTPEAVKSLAATALEDPMEEVRQSCLDYLEKKPNPEAVAYFVGMLKSKDNRIVNRAAQALGRMRDPSAIGPLIDALITTHKFKVQGDPNRHSYSFGGAPSSGPPGFSFGGNGPKIYTQHIPNEAVREALQKLTGKDFNFDKQAWKYWFAAQKRPEAGFDGRRG